MSTGNWFRRHRRQVAIHSCVIAGFLLFTLFASGPLFDRLQPQETAGEAQRIEISVPAETGNIRYYLQHTTNDRMAEFFGWAFIEGKGAEASTIYIVLRSDERVYSYQAHKRDVVTLNRVLGIDEPDLTQAGFIAVISLAEIEKGTYTVGIHIRKGEGEALQYTDVEIEW